MSFKSDISRSEHVEELKRERMKKIVENEEAEKCPCCSGKLVLRKSEYGEFYGCSNYPNCRFIKKI